jgi:hypothetical protein
MIHFNNKISGGLFFLGVGLFLVIIASSQVFFGGWWYPIYTILTLYLLIASLSALALSLLIRPYLLGQFLARVPPLPLILTIIFVIYLISRNTYAYDAYLGLQHTYLVMAGVLAYFITYLCLWVGRFSFILPMVLVFMSLVQAALALYQFQTQSYYHPFENIFPNLFSFPFIGETLNSGYITGSFATRGTLSVTLVVGVIFCLSFLVWGKISIISKIILFWISLVLISAVALTMSRAGYVGLVVGVLAFLTLSASLTSRYSLINRWYLVAALFTLVLGSFTLFFVLYYSNFNLQLRVSQLFDDPYRESLWAESFSELMRLNPYFGTGGHSFDLLSLRHVADSSSARHVFAHNDWIQLTIEFGWVGLLIWFLLLITHLYYGIRGIYRAACQVQYDGGILPQNNQLALLIACFCSVLAFCTHSLFDYQANVLSPIILLAIFLGALGSIGAMCSSGYLILIGSNSVGTSLPQLRGTWLTQLFGVSVSVLLLVIGAVSYSALKPNLLPEYYSLLAETSLVEGNLNKSWGFIQAGADPLEGDEVGNDLLSQNPRLLTLAGEVSGLLANQQTDKSKKRQLLKSSARYWDNVIAIRPRFAYAHREGALAKSWMGNFSEALPMHLRAIALDPFSGLGYEYFGLYFWLNKQYPQAISLLHMGRGMHGGRVSVEFLPIVEGEYKASLVP